jgi:hypothetical protein
MKCSDCATSSLARWNGPAAASPNPPCTAPSARIAHTSRNRRAASGTTG